LRGRESGMLGGLPRSCKIMSLPLIYNVYESPGGKK
jgi:hypothetical protein